MMRRVFRIKKPVHASATNPQRRLCSDHCFLRFQICLTSCVLVCVTFFANATAQENGTDFTVYTRPDLHTEKYYAANDPSLEEAFTQLRTWWNSVALSNLNLTRGYVDQYLPLTLQKLHHHAADAMMRRFAEYLWSQQCPTTDLVPTSFPFFDPTSGVSVQNHQAVSFPAKLPEFLRWFPTNSLYRQHAKEILDGTMTFHNFLGGGVYPWVDVSTGIPAGTVTLLPALGSFMEALGYFTIVTTNHHYLQVADQKNEFIWQHRPNLALPILPEVLSLTDSSPAPPTSDTDTLYYVRQLYNLWWLLKPFPVWREKADKYRDQALAVTNQWYETGWLSSAGHFTRKLNFDGTPADTRLYGDGKANTLYVLVWAYRATGDPKYLKRLKTAWSNLLAQSTNGTGLVDDLFESGVGNGQLEDHIQPALLDVLTFAYEVSGDPAFLRYAQAQADKMLALGDAAVAHTSPENVGPPFLRFTLAHQSIWRLQIQMGQRDQRLRIQNAQGITVLDAQVPAESAVVFLPQGKYKISVGSQTKSVTLQANRTLSFA